LREERLEIRGKKEKNGFFVSFRITMYLQGGVAHLWKNMPGIIMSIHVWEAVEQ
jgi:hypothetical protein